MKGEQDKRETGPFLMELTFLLEKNGKYMIQTNGREG